MSATAPSVQPSATERILPLAQAWLIGFASLLAALVERCGGRHQRLLRPLVQLIERRLAMWLFLSAFARLNLPPKRCCTASPFSAPQGFRRTRADRARVRHRVRCGGQGSLAARLQRVAAIMANPERLITRLAARLERGRVASRLIALAPPAHVLHGINAAAFAPADTS